MIEKMIAKGGDPSIIIPYRSMIDFDKIIKDINDDVVKVGPSTFPEYPNYYDEQQLEFIEEYKDFLDMNPVDREIQLYLAFITALPPNKQKEALNIHSKFRDYLQNVRDNITRVCKSVTNEYWDKRFVAKCKEADQVGHEEYFNNLPFRKKYTLYRDFQKFDRPPRDTVSSDSEEELFIAERRPEISEIEDTEVNVSL